MRTATVHPVQNPRFCENIARRCISEPEKVESNTEAYRNHSVPWGVFLSEL